MMTATIETATMADEVSGTTTLHDGTKAHWTEGYSPVVFVLPDGEVVVAEPDGKCRLPGLLDELEAAMYAEMRVATPEEEAAHKAAMQRA